MLVLSNLQHPLSVPDREYGHRHQPRDEDEAGGDILLYIPRHDHEQLQGPCFINDNLQETTKIRLLRTNDVLEDMRYDALHFGTPMKMLTLPVTKDLRIKLFSIFTSLSLSVIIRLVQQHVT